jgi:hypothetical protein
MKFAPRHLTNRLLAICIVLMAVSLVAMPVLVYCDLDDCSGDYCECESGPANALAAYPVVNPIFDTTLLPSLSLKFPFPLAACEIFHPPLFT